MQSSFGKINFVRKFTADFSETIKPLQKLIRKDGDFKWDDEKKYAFNKSRLQYLKLRCFEVPTLVKKNSSIISPPTNP
jgi:hypothetical protein